ncbi:hypothetical protein H2200_012996 [Cladophialophora chaetospira]|uniref:Uncharacterized protein n=1 Tax=Cladophialophora chaetospira TaxID=386627 RepID=A0AA38WWK0_9EURO|nr:hypothetical protein H2200_012996 [Cladophialophora chaetospira]
MTSTASPSAQAPQAAPPTSAGRYVTSILTTQTTILKSRIRRRQTTKGYSFVPSPADPRPTSDEDVRNIVFKEIIKRLKESKISTETLNPLSLAWCLPLNGSDIDDWRFLLAEPTFVNDAELQQLLGLRLCSKEDTNPPEDHTLLYIRSLAFTKRELVRVLSDLARRGEYIPKAKTWLRLLERKPDHQPIFLRYCGEVSSKSPWARHLDALRSDVQGPLKKIFLTTKLLYPEILAGISIFEVVRGRVTFKASHELVSLREQSLIALMGHPSLLNVQTGGVYVELSVALEDADAYDKLQMRTVDRLRSGTRALSPEALRALGDYADSVQEYANTNPHSTGTSVFTFTDHYRDVIYEQAIPVIMQKQGYTPLVTIGHDPTLDTFRSASSFYESDNLTRRNWEKLINLFASLETASGTINSKEAYLLHQDKMLPFVDMFQWPLKSRTDYPTAITLLRQYIQIVNPILAVTWGEEVTSTALGRFQHDFGMRQGDFAGLVGSALIVNYSEPDGKIDDNACLVVIPCYHPNSVSYGAASPEAFMEVFGKTMAVAWQACCLAFDLPQSPSKLQSCRQLVEMLTDKVGPSTDFGVSFQESKKRFASFYRHQEKAVTGNDAWQLKGARPNRAKGQDPNDAAEAGVQLNFAPTVETHHDIWATARTELQMVIRCEWAKGPVFSANRRTQALKLFQAAIRPLMTTRSSSDEIKFLQWASAVDRGDLYYFAATRYLDHVKDIPNLLSLFLAPSHQRDDAWKEDAGVYQQASDDMQKWIKEGVLTTGTTVEKAHQRADMAWTSLMKTNAPELYTSFQNQLRTPVDVKEFTDPGERISGAEISLIPWKKTVANSVLLLHWADNEGAMQHLLGVGHPEDNIILSAGIMPMYAGEIRRIYFVPTGVDIRDSEERSLGARSPTIPLSDVVLQLQDPIRSKFLQLWSRETGLDPATEISRPGIAADAAQVSGTGPYYPASAFNARSRPNEELRVGGTGRSFRPDTEKDRIRQFLPLQPGDALWLLHKFLEEAYPDDGAIVDTGNPNIFSDADSVWTRLEAFLAQPKWRFHPCLGNLQSVVEAAKTVSQRGQGQGVDAGIEAAFETLRPPVTRDRRRRWVKELRAQKWKVIYKVGPDNAANILMPDNEPELLYEELEEVINDDFQISTDGELVVDDTIEEMLLDPNVGRTRPNIGADGLEAIRAQRRQALRSMQESPINFTAPASNASGKRRRQ